MKNRCEWATKHPIEEKYHDEEWGVPIHDDQKLFEMLILEGQQSGLSWLTILMKRENYRDAFDQFSATTIAKYGSEKIVNLLDNPGIVRNKLKINAIIHNANMFLKIRKDFGSFDDFIWSFVGGKPIVNQWENMSEIPSKTEISDKMSKDLKKHGFKFVGSTTCYAFMQSVGMVNDHVVSCFRYKAV